ncbi:MAG: DUF4437 domain-containing protein [Gemmatimonadota bacterium]|nr:DUF4437 domain-containing protein [Gemmatimonadota bacterium]
MRTYLLLTLALGVSVCVTLQAAADNTATKSATRVVLSSEVKWEPLNPARGDKSPKAATLWGDRKGSVPTGFLVQFLDGFSSPPHIHNVSYRGVVISGLIHNDDPDAADMWMPTGSFWTQPKGELHITAAKGNSNLAYIEIEEGPYLVLPKEKAFDSRERPVNVDASNIVWLDASIITRYDQSETSASASEPRVAFLWGNPQGDQLNGTLIKLPPEFTGRINSSGSTFHGVVIKGRPQYQVSETEAKTLEPGSYFSSEGESIHQISSKTGRESIIYVRTNGKYDVIPERSKM